MVKTETLEYMNIDKVVFSSPIFPSFAAASGLFISVLSVSWRALLTNSKESVNMQNVKLVKILVIY